MLPPQHAHRRHASSPSSTATTPPAVVPAPPSRPTDAPSSILLLQRAEVVTVQSTLSDAPVSTTAATSKGLPIGPMIGGILAGVALVLLVGGLWWWWVANKPRARPKKSKKVKGLRISPGMVPPASSKARSKTSSGGHRGEDEKAWAARGGPEQRHDLPLATLPASYPAPVNPFQTSQDSLQPYPPPVAAENSGGGGHGAAYVDRQVALGVGAGRKPSKVSRSVSQTGLLDEGVENPSSSPPMSPGREEGEARRGMGERKWTPPEVELHVPSPELPQWGATPFNAYAVGSATPAPAPASTAPLAVASSSPPRGQDPFLAPAASSSFSSSTPPRNYALPTSKSNGMLSVASTNRFSNASTTSRYSTAPADQPSNYQRQVSGEWGVAYAVHSSSSNGALSEEAEGYPSREEQLSPQFAYETSSSGRSAYGFGEQHAIGEHGLGWGGMAAGGEGRVARERSSSQYPVDRLESYYRPSSGV